MPLRPNASTSAHASIDAYAPAEIAERVRDLGVRKAQLDLPRMFALSVLAGAFIGLGAALSTVSIAGFEGGYGLRRVTAGVSFSLGLILIVLAGAELFTGNNLVIMAWASRLVTTRELLRNWSVVYLGNLIGAVGTAGLIFFTAPWITHPSQVGDAAFQTALVKCQLSPVSAFFLGVLANALVCLAVWLSMGARSTTDKILAVVFPISAFVALGFEHSIANMYFFAIALLLKTQPELVAGSIRSLELITVSGALWNLVPVTLGNIVGGGGLVGGMYWFIYLRPPPTPPSPRR